MKCQKCGRSDISRAGPFTMHQRHCKSKGNWATFKKAQEIAPIVRETKSPTPIRLDSKHAKSYLTQFIMNLEATKTYAQSLLDMIDKQEIDDFRKSRGYDL